MGLSKGGGLPERFRDLDFSDLFFFALSALGLRLSSQTRKNGGIIICCRQI